jgi:hypothetical protein
VVTFDQNESITYVRFSLFDPDQVTIDLVKNLLPATDWSNEKIPDNYHVVYLALANFSKKLSVSFVTYQTDNPQNVNTIYWGGNYKDLQPWH